MKKKIKNLTKVLFKNHYERKLSDLKEWGDYRKMIKVENLETFGFRAALRGMRNPLNSW